MLGTGVALCRVHVCSGADRAVPWELAASVGVWPARQPRARHPRLLSRVIHRQVDYGLCYHISRKGSRDGKGIWARDVGTAGGLGSVRSSYYPRRLVLLVSHIRHDGYTFLPHFSLSSLFFPLSQARETSWRTYHVPPAERMHCRISRQRRHAAGGAGHGRRDGNSRRGR